jgi:predicted nucleotide-binding protein
MKLADRKNMAQKRTRTTQRHGETQLAPSQAAEMLRSLVEKGRTLLGSRPITSANQQAWETICHELLIRAFGSTSPNIERVMSVGRFDFFTGNDSEIVWEQKRAENMQTRLEILDSLIDLLDSHARLTSTGSVATTLETPDSAISSNRVFLVHGHNEAAIHATARFLERLGIDVVILREQPNSGRTIIEKFVDYSDVAYAIVLLTGDDRGGVASASEAELRPRPRQNVIFELGFFLGKVGRNRVCALHQSGVEIPSDYSGVLFLPIDNAGAWRLSLARELKSAGLSIDMNDAV